MLYKPHFQTTRVTCTSISRVRLQGDVGGQRSVTRHNNRQLVKFPVLFGNMSKYIQNLRRRCNALFRPRTPQMPLACNSLRPCRVLWANEWWYQRLCAWVCRNPLLNPSLGGFLKRVWVWVVKDAVNRAPEVNGNVGVSRRTSDEKRGQRFGCVDIGVKLKTKMLREKLAPRTEIVLPTMFRHPHRTDTRTAH